MARRLWIYTSKTEDRVIARIAEQATARAQADATLGIANWVEWDLSADVQGALGELVNVARARVDSADGTGRWRWRTTADTLKAWAGEPPTYTCPVCDQSTTADFTRAVEQFKREMETLRDEIARLQQQLAEAATTPTG